MECTGVFFVSDMTPAYEACKTCMSGSGTIRLEGQDKLAGVWEQPFVRLTERMSSYPDTEIFLAHT